MYLLSEGGIHWTLLLAQPSLDALSNIHKHSLQRFFCLKQTPKINPLLMEMQCIRRCWQVHISIEIPF